MQVTVSRRDLAKAAADCARIASTATSLPVLKNTLLEAGPAGLRVAATNLEQGLELQIAAQVIEDGQTTVPASELAQILANLPEGDLALRIEPGATEGSGRFVIRSGKSDYRLAYLPAEASCVLPEVDAQATIEIGIPAFRAALEGCVWACDGKETRLSYNSARLLLRNGRVEVEVARGDFLPRRYVSPERMTGLDGYACNLPGESASELVRCLPNEGSILIEIGEGQASFRFGAARFTSGIRAGAWPNSDRVIPAAGDLPSSVEFEKATLLDALRRLSVYSSAEELKAVRLTLDGATCRVLAWSDLGHATEEFDAPGTADISLGMNAARLKQAAETLPGERLRLQMKAPLQVAMLTPIDGQDALTLLMPINLDGKHVPGED